MIEKYGHDDVVETRAAGRCRVLWTCGRDNDGTQTRLHVKSLTDKHRKAFKIYVKNIINHEPRVKHEDEA